MKNAIFSGNTFMRLLKPAAFTLLFASILNTAPAQTPDKPKDVPAAVTYLGSSNGKPLFQIAFNNPQGEETSVTLRDEDGYAIYTDVSKDKSYSRKLQFEGLDIDQLQLTLTLRTKHDTQTKTFEITRNTRTIEDVAVVSLK